VKRQTKFRALTAQQVSEIRAWWLARKPIKKVVAEYGVSISTILRVRRGCR